MSGHRRIQDGGDPAQGPAREMANEPVAPQADNEFPDTPDENRSDVDAVDD